MEAKPCENHQVVYFTVILMQVLLLLLFSHLIHLVLKHLGQPSVISQMLAGILMGPSGLGGIEWAKSTVFGLTNPGHLTGVASAGPVFFMFLIGLEMDFPYLRRSAWRAAVVAYGGSLVCILVGGASAPLIKWQMGAVGGSMQFIGIIVLLFSNTAAPVLIRMTTELKLAASEVGRLAISAALINDMTCLVLISFVSSFTGKGFSVGVMVKVGLLAAMVLVLAAAVIRPVVGWLNWRNHHRRHISNWEAAGVLMFVLAVSMVTEILGYSSMMASFVMGMLFPRQGSTARTLEDKLTYPVYNIFLPIYFGYTGIQADLSRVFQLHLLSVVFTVVGLSTAAKVGGTVLATNYLKIPFHEGLVLGFLLNVKGHVDLIILTMASKNGVADSAYRVLLVIVVMNTLAAGPAAAAVVRLEREALRYRAKGLQWRDPRSELRVIACVHHPRDVPTMLNLIKMLKGIDSTPLAAYVMHLIEFTGRVTTRMLYHQVRESDTEDEWELGGNNARHILAAIDGFRAATGITIRHVNTISAMADMYKDVCNGAEDVRASVVVVPFHKHQRIDGKMQSRRDKVRAVNLKVLRHIPCTVGILVDRGLNGAPQGEEVEHHVVVLFFGGPDDREAVSFGCRIAMNPSIRVTVVRFLPASRKGYEMGIKMQASTNDEVMLAISDQERENKADSIFLSDFHNRDVASGLVMYMEKFVENGAETVTTLRLMVGMYSLYLVGRGRRTLSPLTTGLSDWEECPELGPIGDLLASSDFMNTGSVLVLQQCNRSKEDD